MADINALLAQGVALPQIENPLNQFAKLQALRNAQQEIEAKNVLGQLYAKHYDPSTGDVNYQNMLAEAAQNPITAQAVPTILSGAQSAATAKAAQLRSQQLAAQEEATAAAKTQETESAQTKSALQASRSNLEYVNTPEQLLKWHERNHANPALKKFFESQGIDKDERTAELNATLAQPNGFETALDRSKRALDNILGVKPESTGPKIGAYSPGDYTTASWAKFVKSQNPEDLKLKPTATEQKAAVEANLPDLTPKEIQKREAVYPKASASYRAANQELDSLITDLKTLRDHSGLEGITGVIKGRTPGVTSQARAAEALLEKIQARGQFRTLQEMRMNSPTGGALGNVSDFEGRTLRSSFGALDRRQATEDFQKQIDNTISDLQNSKQNIAQAYEDTYSYKQDTAPAAGAAPAGGDLKTLATSAFGSYDPSKFDYRINPSTGKVQRKAK